MGKYKKLTDDQELAVRGPVQELAVRGPQFVPQVRRRSRRVSNPRPAEYIIVDDSIPVPQGTVPPVPAEFVSWAAAGESVTESANTPTGVEVAPVVDNTHLITMSYTNEDPCTCGVCEAMRERRERGF